MDNYFKCEPIKTGFYNVHVNIVTRTQQPHCINGVVMPFSYITLDIQHSNMCIHVPSTDSCYHVLCKYRDQDIRIHVFRCNPDEYPYKSFGLTIVD